MLKIEKFVDKKSTYAFDILTYSIVITNTSNFTITNVFFKDKIPKGTIFIENSVKVDDVKTRCLRPDNGFYIKKINYRSSVIIKFRVLVLPQCFIQPITNFSTIQQNHILNIEEAPIKLNIYSNIVSSEFQRKVFKQINICENIRFKKNIDKILKYEVNVKILKSKIVDSPINRTSQKNRSNMCILVIIGYIEYKIKFLSGNKKNNNANIIRYKFGFSSYLMTPIGIAYIKNENIKINLNYASANLVNKNLIVTSTNLYLYFENNLNANRNLNPLY